MSQLNRQNSIDTISYRMLNNLELVPTLKNGRKSFIVCFSDEPTENIMKQIDEFYEGHAYVIILDAYTHNPVDCLVIVTKDAK